MPPVAASEAEYALPAVAEGKEVVVTRRVVAAVVIVIEKVAVTLAGVSLLSVTVAVNVLVPAVVGVPPIAPFLLIFSPAGKLPAVICQTYGRVPPFASKLAEYKVPTTP